MSAQFIRPRSVWLTLVLFLSLTTGCVTSRVRFPFHKSMSLEAASADVCTAGAKLPKGSTAEPQAKLLATDADIRTSKAFVQTSAGEPVLSAADAHSDSSQRISAALWKEEIPTEANGKRGDAKPKNAEDLPAPGLIAPSRTLSFQDAIEIALLQNPDAVTARAGNAANDAGRRASAVYPWNPTVQLQVDPYARDRDGSLLATKNNVQVTQTLELAHQPRYRRQAADATWSQQRATIAQTEWTALTTAMRAYFDSVYKKGLADLANTTATQQIKMSEIVDRRVTAGLSTPTERLTASVAARQSQKQAALASADFRVAMNTLRVALNLSCEDQVELDNNLDRYEWASIDGGLSETACGDCECGPDDCPTAGHPLISSRPDVVAARFAVSSAQANLDLARANRLPNVATGPSYERDESGTLFFGVAAQMDLPVWNTGSPLVRQRSAELQQQLITWKQTRARAAAQIQAAFNRYKNARAMWEADATKTSEADSELTSAADSFQQGQATIIEVLSIQASILQERKSHLDIFNEVSQAAVDVIVATAINPTCVVQSGRDSSGPLMEVGR
jgi:cobalt-zinc-cadmium efflux system outer membrane protein